MINTRIIGKMGEDIATNYLVGLGYTLLARNYQKKWGEVDIIAQKTGIIHFFEVKSVRSDFSHVTNAHTPEENVHPYKLKHISRMIETFMFERGKGMSPFQFHVLTVRMDMLRRRARVCWFENIII